MQMAIRVSAPPAALPPVADSLLVALWLGSKRSVHTRRAYARDIARFLVFVDHRPLAEIALGDLQAYAVHLEGLDYSPSSRRRMVNALKSLLTFGAELRYLPFNVGAALKPPRVKNTLAERILTEEQVISMIALTPRPRDKVLVRLAYATGGRVSELVGLRWRDVQPNREAGQVTLFGKGGETRAVAINRATYAALLALRGGAGANDPVFVSRLGRPLSISQAWRIIREAGARAGVPHVSPHWLRHSHASHALEKGAPASLVRDTLGHSSLAVTSRYLHAKPGESSAHYLTV